MRRSSAALGSFLFFFVAPGTVAGLVPWWITGWQTANDLGLFRRLGDVLIGVGLAFLIRSFVEFAWKGLGTPAPIAPPVNLVVSGYYRYVRNPMYVAVGLLVIGQALLFGDFRLLILTGVFWLAFDLFVRFYEEPNLKERFGADYELYLANVPRWIPRFRPWTGPLSN